MGRRRWAGEMLKVGCGGGGESSTWPSAQSGQTTESFGFHDLSASSPRLHTPLTHTHTHHTLTDGSTLHTSECIRAVVISLLGAGNPFSRLYLGVVGYVGLAMGGAGWSRPRTTCEHWTGKDLGKSARRRAPNRKYSGRSIFAFSVAGSETSNYGIRVCDLVLWCEPRHFTLTLR